MKFYESPEICERCGEPFVAWAVDDRMYACSNCGVYWDTFVGEYEFNEE